MLFGFRRCNIINHFFFFLNEFLIWYIWNWYYFNYLFSLLTQTANSSWLDAKKAKVIDLLFSILAMFGILILTPIVIWLPWKNIERFEKILANRFNNHAAKPLLAVCNFSFVLGHVGNLPSYSLQYCWN